MDVLYNTEQDNLRYYKHHKLTVEKLKVLKGVDRVMPASLHPGFIGVRRNNGDSWTDIQKRVLRVAKEEKATLAYTSESEFVRRYDGLPYLSGAVLIHGVNLTVGNRIAILQWASWEGVEKGLRKLLVEEGYTVDPPAIVQCLPSYQGNDNVRLYTTSGFVTMDMQDEVVSIPGVEAVMIYGGSICRVHVVDPCNWKTVHEKVVRALGGGDVGKE